MKRLFDLYKPHVIRPIIYRLIAKLIIGLLLALIWARNFNAQNLPISDAFFILGMCFLAMAWPSYLKLDGVKVRAPFLSGIKAGLKKRKHVMKHMADYAEDKTDPDDALSENEISLAALSSNILTGSFFLLLTGLSWLWTKFI